MYCSAMCVTGRGKNKTKQNVKKILKKKIKPLQSKSKKTKTEGLMGESKWCLVVHTADFHYKLLFFVLFMQPASQCKKNVGETFDLFLNDERQKETLQTL